MARIKIKDLPKDQKISKAEMKKVMGAFNPQPEPPGILHYYKEGKVIPSPMTLGFNPNIGI